MEAEEHKAFVLQGARSQNDLAEAVFPSRSANGIGRIPVNTCWGVLAGMFALLLTSILAVLRRRDIH